MPHLDEGALWVRATMPYTISFDESAKIAPKVRDILRSFPEVTTVASELGRPDDGTDPTGFFNVEFYVDLKPYSQWTRILSHQGRSDRGHQPEARGLPRHHLQLHPAGGRCGGRSGNGLEERPGRQGLRLQSGHAAEERARPSSRCWSGCAGIRDVTLVQELGQPSLTIKINRAKIARYGLNVADINGSDPDGHRRRRGHPGGAGREAVRSGRAPGTAVPRQSRGNRQHPGGDPRRPADSAQGIRGHSR